MFCEKCGTKRNNTNFCPNCGNSFEENTSVEKAAITDDFKYEQISEFLNNAKLLEVHKYTLGKTIQNLKSKINDLNYTENVKRNNNNDPITEAVCIFMPGLIIAPVIGLIISLIIGGNFWGDLGWTLLIETQVWGRHLKTILWCYVALVLISIVVGLVNIPADRKNQKIYEQNLQQVNEDYKYRQGLINDINEEISKYQSRITDMENTLNKLYSVGVVYSKYCSMIPIITICEYFEVGRCNSLKGEHGAYNLFENEIRQNIIISKLDDVITQLHMIEQTQHMLYDAIQSANRISNQILEQNEQLISCQHSIAENSAAISYNTKVIKDNTTVSAFADLLKM